MKRSSSFLMIAMLCVVLFSSCDALKKMQTSDNDDVYLDPKKDRSAFYKPEEIPAPAANKTAAVIPQEDDNNPYYQDPSYSPDDYYDNQYASRLKRFHNPTSGLGYYDSYYTNSYFYNQNPYQYGVSIYNGYSFWGPSYNNYMYMSNYNWGGNYGYGSNFGYNNYCGNGFGWGVNYGYNNPYYNNWYNPYSFNNCGYTNYGYYNPYGYNNYGNNNYGYNNSYDYNSSTYYGPRVAHSGGNSRTVINPGMAMVKKEMAPNTSTSEPKVAVAPTDIKRFDHNVVAAPKSNFVKQPVVESTPRTIHSSDNTGFTPGPKTATPVKGKEEIIITPINNNETPVSSQPKPKKGLFNGDNNPHYNNNSSNSQNNNGGGKKWENSQPANNNSSSGSSTPSGGNSGGGGGGVKPSGGLRPR